MVRYIPYIPSRTLSNSNVIGATVQVHGRLGRSTFLTLLHCSSLVLEQHSDVAQQLKGLVVAPTVQAMNAWMLRGGKGDEQGCNTLLIGGAGKSSKLIGHVGRNGKAPSCFQRLHTGCDRAPVLYPHPHLRLNI